MTTEKIFYENLIAWNNHCEDVQYSLRPDDYLACPAYHNIIALGKDALPFIRNAYNLPEDISIPLIGWGPLLRTIIGNAFQIPKTLEGRLLEIKHYCKDWLDTYFEMTHQR